MQSSEPLRYVDFPVEITREPTAAQVRVLGAVPGGEMLASEAEQIAPDLAALAPLVRKAVRRRLEEGDLVALGTALGELLLPGRVRELFELSRAALGPGQGLRLRLAVEPDELAALPWELAHAPRTRGEAVAGDFLVLQPGLSLVRDQRTGAPVSVPPGRASYRIVVGLASPEGHPILALDNDRKAIESAVEAASGGGPAITAKVILPLTRDVLTDALADTDVFHFGGHGTFSQTDVAAEGTPITRGALLLENADGEPDALDSAQFAVALGDRRVRLVVLGACQSAERDARGTWSGVAPALVRANIPAVVAMQFGFLDDSAPRFFSAFYQHVLTGHTIDEAVAVGRLAVLLVEGGLQNRDWATPVLYSRAGDGIVFPLPEKEEQRSGLNEIRMRAVTVRGEMIGALGESCKDTRIDMTVDTVETDGVMIGLVVDPGDTCHGR